MMRASVKTSVEYCVRVVAAMTLLVVQAWCPTAQAITVAEELKAQFAADPLTPEFTCESSSLRQALLDLSRKAGASFIFDEGLTDRKISERFEGVPVSRIIETLAGKYNFEVECIAQNTFLIQPAAAVESSNAQVPMNQATPVSASTAGLEDSLLALATPPAGAGGETTTPPEAEPTEMAIPPKHLMLEGGIRLSDKMPPVDESLKAGATFTEQKMKKLEAQAPDNQWARLPNWAGGKWKTRSQSNYYRYSYQHKSKDFSVRTFTFRAGEGLGYQTDRRGDLWEWDRANYWTRAENDEMYVLDFHKHLETKYKDEKEFTEYFVSTRVIVNRSNMRVERCYQMESIQTYINPEPGVMRCRASMKEFDETGMPVELVKGVCYSTKMKEYAPVVQCRGENLPKLFAQYLKRNNLAHLIPAGAER
ncbi:MAG: hypothetical protein K2W95_18495 [Candidatus Obscuribacterales bacterium]|nr:hypothetical protein [Candidatus Obscuribacterales bacterium]